MSTKVCGSTGLDFFKLINLNATNCTESTDSGHCLASQLICVCSGFITVPVPNVVLNLRACSVAYPRHFTENAL